MDMDDCRTAIHRVFELTENIVMFLDGENKICWWKRYAIRVLSAHHKPSFNNEHFRILHVCVLSKLSTPFQDNENCVSLLIIIIIIIICRAQGPTFRGVTSLDISQNTLHLVKKASSKIKDDFFGLQEDSVLK